MPRLTRLDIPNIPQHLVQRGNNRQPIFFDEDDYCCFLDYLREGLSKYSCQLHAYALMTNHVHLLVKPNETGAVSGLMQSLGRRYVRSINSKYRRTGTLFEGRFKSSLIDSESYLLACMRYIELNPVRAGIVDKPDDYAWSSYRQHVNEQAANWLTEPEEFLRLAASADLRAEAYRELFNIPLKLIELEQIRNHLNKNCALGTDRFQKEIEAVAGRRAAIVKQGRPRNSVNVQKQL